MSSKRTRYALAAAGVTGIVIAAVFLPPAPAQAAPFMPSVTLKAAKAGRVADVYYRRRYHRHSYYRRPYAYPYYRRYAYPYYRGYAYPYYSYPYYYNRFAYPYPYLGFSFGWW